MHPIAFSPTAQAQQLPGAQSLMLHAAANGGGLAEQLRELAAQGGLEGFLEQTGAVLDLARTSPALADGLEPVLAGIRDALGELPTDNLSRVERDALESTLDGLDAYLGVDGDVDQPGPVEQVPGGGLEAHEDVGGHLIERHVGKSEQWLLDRVRGENISAASSFRDLPEAERFVALAIAEHQDSIDAWLDGAGGKRLVIDSTFEASSGISVSRGQDAAEDVHSVRLVLERSDKLDIGFRIVTGYPSAP